MAIGAQNRQQMSPAQFVGQANEGRLVDPRNYSSPNFNAQAFQPQETMRLVQDAMQKQAAFEAAYQEQQTNMGWNMLNQVLASLDKGAVAAGRYEDMKAKALANQLDQEFGKQERQADLESKRTQTAMNAFDLGLKQKYGEEEARALLDQRKAQTKGTEADTRAKQIEAGLVEKFGERSREAEIRSSETAARVNESQLLAAERTLALRALAGSEINKIRKLYTEASQLSDGVAFDRLNSYELPAELMENPEAYSAVMAELEKNKGQAAENESIKLNKLSRQGYERLAQKLYLDSPQGQKFGAYIKEVLNQSRGFLTSQQTEMIQTAFEKYSREINPRTKLKLPEIISTLDTLAGGQRDERIAQTREKDLMRQTQARISDTALNQLMATAVKAQDDFATPQAIKDELMSSVLGQLRMRGLSDDKIQLQIQMMREAERVNNAKGAGGSKPAQNVQKANLQNLETYQ